MVLLESRVTLRYECASAEARLRSGSIAAADQIFATVDVSDTTYARDRRKVALYVSAGIRSFIVNIQKRRVEQYETHADLATKSGRVYALGETFALLGVSIAVADLFEPVPG